MKVLSLFDGISCGQLALQRANIYCEKYFASEINKQSIGITKRNFPETIQIGDVQKVSYKDGILTARINQIINNKKSKTV